MSNYLRLWTTGLAAGHGPRFDDLAVTHSIPLFQSIPGCFGAVFARSEEKGYVLTVWIDEASADAASQSPIYLEAVQHIGKSGVMAGEQALEQLAISGSFMATTSVFGF